MKAILIVDIPKEFENREPYYVEGTLFCHIDDYYAIYRYVGDIPKTKLKPIPQKVDEISIEETMYRGETIILEKVIEKARQQGYNKCINEILEDEQ